MDYNAINLSPLSPPADELSWGIGISATPAGRGLRALLAADWADWRVRGRSQNCAPYTGSGRGRLAGDWPSTVGILNITTAAWTAGFL